LLVVILFPQWVLSLAGPDFVIGSTALVILACGQFVIVATGPGGFLLSMTGRQAILRNVNVMGALLNVALNAILIPLWGVVGAATATATSLALINLALVWQAKRQVGVNTLPRFAWTGWQVK
jgi:O-antigen/teichoic acid export membrane protein